MRGLWLENGHVVCRHDLATPVPAPGECLVRVIRAGVCSTDVAMIDGLNPFAGVLGHEFVGLVDSGPENLMGRRVTGEINIPCGACPACRAGRGKHCPKRTVIGILGRDGAFAEYIALPAANLHPVPDGVETDAAIFTEPLAAALDVLERVAIGPGDRVLVVGAGRIGQLIARVLDLTGCQYAVVVRSKDKARRLAGTRATGIEAGAVEPGAFDIAIEATGNEAGFEMALGGLRPQGTLVLKSTFQGRIALDPTRIVVDEISLVGSRCGPFDKALGLLEDGKVETASLIDAVLPLDDGVAAIARAQQAGVLKVLIETGNPGG